jgi:hypothetical protein
MNPPNHPSADEPVRIPDLISEQDEADLLRDRDRILDDAKKSIAESIRVDDAVSRSIAEQATIHLNAALMANEIAEYLEVVTDSLEKCVAPKSAAHVRRLAGYARQLEVHALCEVECLTA